MLGEIETHGEILLTNYQSEHSTVILGERLFLGPVWLDVKHYTLEDIDYWRKIAENTVNDFLWIKMGFSPAAEATLYLLNTIEGSDREKLIKQTDLRLQALNTLVASLIHASKGEGRSINQDLLRNYFADAMKITPEKHQILATFKDFTNEEVTKVLNKLLPPEEAQILTSIYLEM
jgi:hypothetical protein